MNNSNNQVQTDSDTPKYRPLSPQPNGENTKHYVQALDYAIKHERISNIAITGSYGSGKSTIIETYIANNPDKRCIKISLAEFTNEDQPNAVKQDVEKSILQQLFYQRDAKGFPDSRFDRIKGRSLVKTIFIALFILTYLVVIGAIFDIAGLGSLINNIFQIGAEAEEVITWKLTLFLTFMILSFFVIFAALNAVKSIKKLNLKLETIGEIALDKQSEGSILNIYFDEIKYFFSESKIDVVFIEDFDRFKKINVELFTKMREINLLLNASLKNSDNKSKQVNFVYALRDDLFQEEGERTKFFDFMIPVIPYVNYSNTGAKLLEGLTNHANEIDRDFIFELAPYISEMRLVHNITNEFKLYLLNLKPFITECPELVTQKKLFAFIVYKNVFPVDFSELNSGKGTVYNLLQSKKIILEAVIEEHRERVKTLEHDLDESNKLILRSSEDNKILLAAKVVDKIRTKNPSWNYFKVGGAEVKKLSIQINADLGGMLLKHDSIIIYNQHGYQATELSYKEELEEYKQNERKKSLLDNRENIEAEIRNLKREIETMKGQELFELLEGSPEEKEKLNDLLKNISSGEDKPGDGISAKNLSKEVDPDKLLIKLVSEGHIDRNYHHYLTYYHSGSQLSPSDQRFIIHVKNRDIGDDHQEYEISNPNVVLNELRLDYFEHQSSWNISLMDDLLKSDKTSYLHALIRGFKKEQSSLLFIRKYYNNKPNFEILMRHLAHQWPEIWDELIQGQSKEWVSELFIKLVEDLDSDSWKQLNKTGAIKRYIQEDSRFVEVVKQLQTTSTLANIFKNLDVKFYELEFSTPLNKRAKELFDIIVKGNFYELNSYMLNLIISTSCPQRMDDFKKRQLSLFLEGTCDIVRDRIISDFEEYIDPTYLALDTPQEDSEAFLLRLVNDNLIEDSVSAETKANILKKQSTKFTQISSVKNQELWTDILALGRVVATWENIARYFHYSEFVINETLLACLSDSNFVSELCKKKMNANELDGLAEGFEGVTKKLNVKLVDDLRIPDDQYQVLIRSSYFRWSSYGLTKLTPNKILILIEAGKLSASQENLDGLIENGIDLAINFVKTNFDIVIAEVSEGDLQISDVSLVRALIISNTLTNSQKRKLVYLFPEPVLDELEIDSAVAQALANILHGNIEKLDFGFIEKLMQSEELTLDNKLIILTTQVEFIDDHHMLHQLLTPLGSGYEDIFTKSSIYVSVENTDASRNFLHKIKSLYPDRIGAGLPDSDETDKAKIRFYIKTLA